MLIVGDLSGIQEFVFALPAEEGGPERMLRACSFYVQALSEVLAWRWSGRCIQREERAQRAPAEKAGHALFRSAGDPCA